MSIVAEFARKLHEQSSRGNPGGLAGVRFPAGSGELWDIRCVVCDVYGTLVNYWRDEFTDKRQRAAALEAAMGRTADFFDMTGPLEAMNPTERPAATLADLYHGLIAMKHQAARERGRAVPEVRIESVWEVLIRMFERHGYSWPGGRFGGIADLAKCAAFYYNFHSLGRGLYPGAAEALRSLREHNIRLGIVSNGQFYTSVDLTLFLRDATGDRVTSMEELFDPHLTFFSCDCGAAKPDTSMLERLFNALYEYHILPAQTVFVGNDLVEDIAYARDAGMNTAFFTGDRRTAFIRDAAASVTPDISFGDWHELPGKVHFNEKPAR